MNTASGIAGALRNDADEAPFAQKTMKQLQAGTVRDPVGSRDYARDDVDVGNPSFPGSSAKPWRVRNTRWLPAISIPMDRQVMATSWPLLPSSGSNDKSVQVAQATTGDPGRPPEREQHWAETLLLELTIARRDIELLQRLSQENDRAEGTGGGSCGRAARRWKRETAIAEKAREQASRLKQVGESGTAEVQTSLQQERERSARLERDLCGSAA